MPAVGFKPTASAGERPQTYALDCADTGTGFLISVVQENHSEHHFGGCDRKRVLHAVIYSIEHTPITQTNMNFS